MIEAVKTLGLLLLFMFIPVFIPPFTGTLGWVYDVLARGRAPKA
jgi:hypothetical protein